MNARVALSAAAAALLAALLQPARLQAGWGWADSWGFVEEWGDLGLYPSTDDWGISLFALAGNHGSYAIAKDTDADGLMDVVVLLGDPAWGGLARIPVAPGVLYGGSLTKGGWSGVTFIDPATYGDLILLSSGPLPEGLNVRAPVVIDIPEIPEFPGGTMGPGVDLLGSLVMSQVCATRLEWDFEGDGVVDRVMYWGQNGPVLLNPLLPQLGNDLLAIDRDRDNDLFVYVTPPLPGAVGLSPAGPVIPQSNMGFKLNFAAIEGPGPGIESNMGFKLNYFAWQGGESDPASESWWGHCNAWACSSWALLPQPESVTKKIARVCLGSAAAAFDGEISVITEVGMPALDSFSMPVARFSFGGGGRMALFYAENGWSGDLAAQSARIDGRGAAAVLLLEGEKWSVSVGRIDRATPKLMKIGGEKYIGAYSTVNFDPGAEDATWQWDPETNSWLGLLMGAEDRGGLFIRGETNLDSLAGPDISDGIFILQWLFAGGREPLCVDSADVNDDGTVDISDGIALLAFLFIGGSPPKAPFPGADSDPTTDSLGCDLLE